MIRYAAAIFLSAFLLFLVQPLIGKYLLPWFGGGAGVWSACLVFFQVMLLVGYTYAHVISTKASPRWQAIIHGAVMLAGLAFLPIVPAETWKPQPSDEPMSRIVLLLVACIGGPYLALSATGPLLQSWFARTFPGRSPYRLFALSNAGSLIALLGYPAVIEPMFSRRAQAMIWSGGFVLYVVLCGLCAWRLMQPPERQSRAEKRRHKRATAGRGEEADSQQAQPAPVTAFARALWIVLPMCASILLLSFTSRLSEDVAPVPLLWVIPLAVYLLTFIIAFEWPRLYNRVVGLGGMLAAYAIMVVLLWSPASSIESLLHAAGSLAAMFLLCLACHGEVYRLRPGASQLTGYYLAIAAGGALGGVFVTIVAPLIFTFNLEIYLAMFLAFGAVIACLLRDSSSIFFRGAQWPVWGSLTAAVVLAAALIWIRALPDERGTTYQSRNFYGVLQINQGFDREGKPSYNVLRHGRTIHGLQFIDPARQMLPTGYYGPSSGLGVVMWSLPGTGPRKVGVVGLGTGTLAAYGRPGDTFVFYELNSRVTELANERFTYLHNSPAAIEVVPGDGRLSLERQPPQGFDVLVLDAFNGDSVPVHLLTYEAFEIYRGHLAENGAIIVNISNHFLRLDQLTLRLASAMNLQSRVFVDDGQSTPAGTPSIWMLMTNNKQLLESEAVKRLGRQLRPEIGNVQLWTDDHSSLFEILIK